MNDITNPKYVDLHAVAQSLHVALLDLEKTRADDDKLTTYEILLAQTIKEIEDTFDKGVL